MMNSRGMSEGIFDAASHSLSSISWSRVYSPFHGFVPFATCSEPAWMSGALMPACGIAAERTGEIRRSIHSQQSAMGQPPCMPATSPQIRLIDAEGGTRGTRKVTASSQCSHCAPVPTQSATAPPRRMVNTRPATLARGRGYRLLGPRGQREGVGCFSGCQDTRRRRWGSCVDFCSVGRRDMLLRQVGQRSCEKEPIRRASEQSLSPEHEVRLAEGRGGRGFAAMDPMVD